MQENPLDAWTARAIGSELPLTRAALDVYQRLWLRETVDWAKRASPFYRRRLEDIDAAELKALGDLPRLPLTTADDLRRNDPPLLCVSQNAISHVVTLDSSGTSGAPKRLFFMSEELEATLDFFTHGMQLPARPGDRVLILFPGGRQGSVGDLLARALARLGAMPILHGWPEDPEAAAAVLRKERPDVVAGTPVAVLAIACHAAAKGSPTSVRSVLLSADHAAESLRRRLADLWGCEVFEHYGMTEMGLGGGVDCSAHAGYHVRESELLVEVVDPASGEAVPLGEPGEVVVTTLRRRGMPLIRYRTGDLSRLLPDPCPCGSPLRRLQRIARRVSGGVDLGTTGHLTIGMLDETVFAVPGVADFHAVFRAGVPPWLDLDVSCTVPTSNGGMAIASAVRVAVEAIPTLKAAGVRVTAATSAETTLLHRGKRRLLIEAER
ncbi:DVU_1553 family AMP-dependent CoA ligase [Propionivibrio soli]|uniref:DVU_1553 family AMP-dependent CoA ligase n=1 Tax=Propionivibrio soli TaxID=2976531 RepID=UPI0021E8992D|nr:AMP-binding protein [Propionivibrio soli]